MIGKRKARHMRLSSRAFNLKLSDIYTTYIYLIHTLELKWLFTRPPPPRCMTEFLGSVNRNSTWIMIHRMSRSLLDLIYALSSIGPSSSTTRRRERPEAFMIATYKGQSYFLDRHTSPSTLPTTYLSVFLSTVLNTQIEQVP